MSCSDSAPELGSQDQIMKGIYIRGLAEARVRNPGTDLARYIDAYITVQVSFLVATLIDMPDYLWPPCVVQCYSGQCSGSGSE